MEGQRHHHHHMQKTRENHVLVHTRHTTYTTRTTHRLVSSRLVSFLLSSLLISISSAILLELTFADMFVGLHENANQHHGTEKLHYPVVCFFLVGRCCCLFAVGRLLVACLFYVCCEFGLVGCHSRTRWTTHKKTTSTGESCEPWR